jgi:hypothetical protein
MSFVFVATLVLEAIVNPPSVWFVLIPIIRGVSLFIMQSSLIYGLMKAREAGTSLALSEVTSKIQFPSELETTQSTTGVCDTFYMSVHGSLLKVSVEIHKLSSVCFASLPLAKSHTLF